MKVVTFNLRCGNDPNGNSIEERAPRLKAVMDRYDADLVGFQEVTPAWMEHLTADFGDEYEIFNKYRAEKNLESTPMMWKKDQFECLDKGYFWLSDTPDIESKGWDTMGCYRICLWATLRSRKTGVEFTFFNTHYGFSDACQLASGKLIMDHISAMKIKAAILTADFNMTPNSAGYRQLTSYFVDVNAKTANDTRTTFHGYNLEHTGSLIDFCFVTPDTITPLASKRIDDLVDGKFPSDHYGVYSEIDVREKLSLVTFNVCNNSNLGKSPEERCRAMRGVLSRYSPDIIGFQEVTPVWLKQFQKMKDYDFACQYRSVNQKEATPIFWKKDLFDLVEEKHFWLSETPEQESKGWGAMYHRICTMVVLRHIATGKKICCFNTHFDFSDQNHVESAALLKARAAEYAGMPVFCTADYNMNIGGAGYRAMRESFKDLRWEVAPRDFTPTINGFDVDMLPPMIIDFVFTNGTGIRPLSYHVIDDCPRGVRLSDHNGIICTFTLENE